MKPRTAAEFALSGLTIIEEVENEDVVQTARSASSATRPRTAAEFGLESLTLNENFLLILNSDSSAERKSQTATEFGLESLNSSKRKRTTDFSSETGTVVETSLY